MPSDSENKELLLVAQRGSEASCDEESKNHNDHITELEAAVRALTHAQAQIDQARVLHARAAADMDELRGQLEDPSLDPFERELLEEDFDHLTSELARHGRRAEAWESKSNTISAEMSDRRARVQAAGKSDADTIYDSVEEVEPPTGATNDGSGPLTPSLSSTDGADGRAAGIVSPGLSMLKPYEIDAAA
eukprot:SAG11_NODE_1600_length_4608_cov_3.690397_3_plen_190_part_00